MLAEAGVPAILQCQVVPLVSLLHPAQLVRLACGHVLCQLHEIHGFQAVTYGCCHLLY